MKFKMSAWTVVKVYLVWKTADGFNKAIWRQIDRKYGDRIVSFLDRMSEEWGTAQ